MVKKNVKVPDLLFGEEVEVPWGFEFSVRGTVHEVYGFDDDLRVVVLVTPELSGQVVDEPTTVVWPISRVQRITPVS